MSSDNDTETETEEEQPDGEAQDEAPRRSTRERRQLWMGPD